MASNTKKRFAGGRLFALILSLLMACAVAPVRPVRAASIVATGLCGDRAQWSLDSDGVLTILGTGPMWDYRPAGVGRNAALVPTYMYTKANNGYQINAHRDGIKSVVISEGITHIGNWAFGAAGSKDRDQLAYGLPYVRGNVVIPDSVISIGDAAFQNARFNGALTLGGSLKSIGDSAFAGSAFTGELIIPDSVEQIGVMPSAVWAAIGDGDDRYGNVEGGLPAGRSFNRATGFTGLKIGSGVKYVGKESFYGCAGLRGGLSVPDGVRYIDAAAFYGCVGFDGALTLGRGLYHIGSQAFYNCKNLTGSLSIPDGVRTVGVDAFHNAGVNGDLRAFYAGYICGGADALRSTPNSDARPYLVHRAAAAAAEGTVSAAYFCHDCGAAYLTATETVADPTDGGASAGSPAAPNGAAGQASRNGLALGASAGTAANTQASQPQSAGSDPAVGGVTYSGRSGESEEARCADPGAAQETCGHACHKSGIQGLFWRLTNFFNKLFGSDRYCVCGERHW